MFNDLYSEFFSWIRGALLVLFIINACVYCQNKKRLFLNYSLFLFFLFLYFLKPVAPIYLLEFYTFFGYSLLYISFVFYLEFTRVLVSTKKNIPKWDRYFKIQKYFLFFVSLLLPLIIYLFSPFVYRCSFLVISTLLMLFSIFAYRAISRIKRRNVKFFIFGSSSFLFLGSISTYFNFLYRNNLSDLSFEPMVFTYVGAIIEALVFTYIMGAIFKQILEKEANLRIQYFLKEKEAEELKMAALQSQMNPHFLFNSLNSINNFVLKNKIDEASDYITKFSNLVRKVLKNSENLEIPLDEELEVLKMYINLEKTRIIGGFKYIQNVDSRISLSDVQVPPLFLQPYIENAIWHGLKEEVTEKIIQLDVLKEDEDIVFIIKDNGPGLDKDAIEKDIVLSKRNFFGSIATEKRIRLMHHPKQVEVYTENISDNGATGTLVCLKFPLKKNK